MPTKTPTTRYGGACASCSHAKCRCVIRNVGESCERCQHLGRECRPMVSARRLGTKKTERSKAAKLEEKIDGLMTLLSSTGRGRMVATQTNGPQPGVEGTMPTQSDAGAGSSNMSAIATPVPVGGSPPTLIPLELEPSPREAEEYLREFRTRRLPYFPFVHIPFSVTSEMLRAERPFFWLCIMALSTKSLSRQGELYARIRQIVAQKMIVELERNLDLLLGLLACISWANLQVRKRPFLTTYTQLANSVVFGFSLNKPPRKALDEESRYRFHAPHVSAVRTLEERRAVLGCFLIGSLISTTLHVIDALKWTPHMAESLEVLSRAQECSGDEILVAMVRLQLIVEKARQSPWSDDMSGQMGTAVTPTPAFYSQALEAELRGVKTILSPEIQKNVLITLHIHYVEISIREIYLSRSFLGSDTADLSRTESLYACTTAARSWFDVFFTIPITNYIGFSGTLFFNLGHAAATLFKLSTLDEPGWNRLEAAKLANVVEIGERVAENANQVAAVAGIELDGEEFDVYSQAAGLLRKAVQSWKAKLRDAGDLDADLEAEARRQEQTLDRMDELADMSLDMPDDAWMRELVTGWAW